MQSGRVASESPATKNNQGSSNLNTNAKDDAKKVSENQHLKPSNPKVCPTGVNADDKTTINTKSTSKKKRGKENPSDGANVMEKNETPSKRQKQKKEGSPLQSVADDAEVCNVRSV